MPRRWRPGNRHGADRDREALIKVLRWPLPIPISRGVSPTAVGDRLCAHTGARGRAIHAEGSAADICRLLRVTIPQARGNDLRHPSATSLDRRQSAATWACLPLTSRTLWQIVVTRPLPPPHNGIAMGQARGYQRHGSSFTRPADQPWGAVAAKVRLVVWCKACQH
jgi:hypothetical protein